MLYAKDPDAVLDYTVDWTDRLEAGETITAAFWEVAPAEAGGLAITLESGSGAQRAATVSGGAPGHVYRLTNRVSTSLGRTEDQSFLIRIIER